MITKELYNNTKTAKALSIINKEVLLGKCNGRIQFHVKQARVDAATIIAKFITNAGNNAAFIVDSKYTIFYTPKHTFVMRTCDQSIIENLGNTHVIINKHTAIAYAHPIIHETFLIDAFNEIYFDTIEVEYPLFTTVNYKTRMIRKLELPCSS